MTKDWNLTNANGAHRVVVTKQLIGERWLRILADAHCRIEYCTSPEVLSKPEIIAAIGNSCVAVIGQFKESWDRELLAALKSAGGRIYSNMVVGYDNVDLAAATSLGIPVGNTPGVLTVTTAELTVALTFAVARRITEADTFVRHGRLKDWSLTLFLGDLLRGKTLGVIGAGRIGSAYARMMVEGHRMNLLYFNRNANRELEDSVRRFNEYLRSTGTEGVSCRRTGTVEELLEQSDVVSLSTPLNDATRHLIDGRRLRLMKKNGMLINVSRGPVVDEAALVEYCRENPEFHAGLDVYEDEPRLKPGLAELPNVVLLPHIGSASYWAREAMSTIAAFNVVGILAGYPVWTGQDMLPFLGEEPPRAVPSIVNARDLRL